MKKWCLNLLVIFVAVVFVHGQNLGDFISIDCGNSRNYTDKNTSLIFTSDDQYINTGINYNISSSYVSQIVQATDLTLRSFPVGNRNCYTLKPAMQNRKYLVRAFFFYGNYDGKYQTNETFVFDLHIGVNFWRTVNISDAGQALEHEAIFVAQADFVSVCLVNKGFGTPFISSLEMRPLKSMLYPTVTASNFYDLNLRRDFGGSKITRYPDDPYDRIWHPRCNQWTIVKTKLNVSTDDSFEVPNVVLQTAILPVNSTDSTVSQLADPTLSIFLIWPKDLVVKNPSYYVNLHFVEVQQLPSNGIREFNVFYDRDPEPYSSDVRPSYLSNEPYYSVSQLPDPNDPDSYRFSFNSTSNATVPPLINAIEVFNLLPVKTAMTKLSDVAAIVIIKAEYQVKKNWSGDPCAPAEYTWQDVGCSNTSSSPRIISLNLSDIGLSGPISTSFLLLEALTMLDLSNNKLNGSIPNFLGNMSSLQFLDLSYNNLTGPIPEVLLTRANSGQLDLRTNGSGILNAESGGKKLNIKLVIIAIISVLLLLASLIAWIFLRNSSQAGTKLHPVPNDDPNNVPNGDPIVHLKTRRYTKTELESITQHFRQEIGKGGFGSVFAGTLPDEKGTRVAIKKLSESSKQGIREFLTETQNLAMLHHRNLVSLVGYCEDVGCFALVYEYMSQGSLEDHLRGKKYHEKTLSWKERLRIAFEAAEGLNYLHQDCSVRFIHRDVKSSNILLTDDLTAKVSDLGIARALPNQITESGLVTTNVCGTKGYMDPKYGQFGFLSQKSDVYSFGVVILEIITGQKPVLEGPEGGSTKRWPNETVISQVNLVERVGQQMAQQNSNIESIIDVRLRGNYSIDSVRSVFELARKCTHDEPEPRPTMEFVVAELKYALKMEQDRLNCGQNDWSTNNQGVNRNSSVATGITNQNLRTALDTFGGGPALR